MIKLNEFKAHLFKSMHRIFSDVHIKEACTWEVDYLGGKWDYLNDTEQLLRYLVIDTWRSMWNSNGKVLDVGCGEGIILEKIHQRKHQIRYVGIDISQTAIKKAQCRIRNREKESFICSSLENYTLTEEPFDIIIFNEVLYYFPYYYEIAEKYMTFLKPDGCCIISICKSKQRVWNTLHTRLNDKCLQAIYVRMLHCSKGWYMGLFKNIPETKGKPRK